MLINKPTLAEKIATLREATEADTQAPWLEAAVRALVMAWLARIFNSL